MTRTLASVCEERIFEKVFKEYSKVVRNFIYFKCGDADRADDLTQDAFVKLWNNCAKVPFEKVKSYLFVLVKNAFFNEEAHKKVVLKYQSSVSNRQDNQDPEFLMREKEFHKQLNEAINGLSEKQREVFLLNRIEKKTYNEIAEMLGISVKAVEKRMHMALSNLRKTIKNYKL